MANPKHIEKLNEGLVVWNTWRDEHPNNRPDLRDALLLNWELTGANLSMADLRWANLRQATLTRANLRGANLCEANLEAADLSKADLSGGNLHGAELAGANLSMADLREADLSAAILSAANLRGSDLRDADLRRANLTGANLSMADLSGADLTAAILNGTVFGFTDMPKAVFDHVSFSGPSALDPDSVLRSAGLPQAFLTGCGWPDRLVEYWDSIASAGIELYSAMISYSSKDRAFARRLYEDLRDRRVRVWRDEHDIHPGDDVREEIDQAVRLYDKLILICSESSLGSYWVDRELSTALGEEMRLWESRGERILKLIPLALDQTWRDATGGRIGVVKERHIEDFSGWEADDKKYQGAFDRVVKALEPGSKIPPPDPKL